MSKMKLKKNEKHNLRIIEITSTKNTFALSNGMSDYLSTPFPYVNFSRNAVCFGKVI